MDIKKFWQLIDQCKYSDNPELRLEELLDGQTADEVMAFDCYLEWLQHYADRADIYGAAYILHQVCDEEEFLNFIRGLIAMGKSVYEATLKDAEHLQWLWLQEPIENESIGWVARKVYARKMGISIFDAMDVLMANSDETEINIYIDGERYEKPEIGEWNFEDEQENRKHLPKLSRLMYDIQLVPNPHLG
ncbi:DUF4240 domain-containing protein [Paraburkholderia phytofirmans]|uniref:DUF4240 domain-containing protein n=1 Tax=Paraburkholderia phytofirmans TaxID=261302 RepID=UPI0038BA7CD6